MCIVYGDDDVCCVREVEKHKVCVNQKSNFFVGGKMMEQGVRAARGRLSHPERRERSPVSRRGSEHFAEAGEKKLGVGASPTHTQKKPNTKRSLTVCIIDALKKSRAPRHMCPSPAAVRRYPNVTLALMVGRPAAMTDPFARRPLRPRSSPTELEISTTKHYPRLRGQPQIFILERAQHVFITTGGRILAWTRTEHEARSEREIRISRSINQFLRRTAATVSRTR